MPSSIRTHADLVNDFSLMQIKVWFVTLFWWSHLSATDAAWQQSEASSRIKSSVKLFLVVVGPNHAAVAITGLFHARVLAWPDLFYAFLKTVLSSSSGFRKCQVFISSKLMWLMWPDQEDTNKVDLQWNNQDRWTGSGQATGVSAPHSKSSESLKHIFKNVLASCTDMKRVSTAHALLWEPSGPSEAQLDMN